MTEQKTEQKPEHEKRIREALEAGPKLAQSSVMHFSESLHGKSGELDAWLECNDEKEVKAHIIAYAGALLADLDEKTRALKYARRFLNAKDCDVAFVDAALKGAAHE